MAVFMFPGQGAQAPGMGSDLLEIPEVAAAFAVASEVSGTDMAKLSREGSEAEINDAYNAQMLAVALSVGLAHALESRDVRPQAALGFSLGQISALMATRALSDADGFALLDVRARSMAKACAETPGAMCALLGASHEQAQAVCDEAAQGSLLVCANYNSPGQVVVSGSVEAIERAEVVWKEHGGKRAARLNTAGAFHSPAMQSASEAVLEKAKQLTWHEPMCPVICNTDALPFDISHAAERLAAQVVSPVRFEQSVQALVEDGATEFIEVGYGAVLNGLVRRIYKPATRVRLGTLEEWNAFTGQQGKGE